MIWCLTGGVTRHHAGWASVMVWSLWKIEIFCTCVIKPRFPGHNARSLVTVPINSVDYNLLCW